MRYTTGAKCCIASVILGLIIAVYVLHYAM
jgi:hypothetical protein